MKIGIVADDLTGACDSIAPFASRGMRCAALVRDAGSVELSRANIDAIAISTETRDIFGVNADLIRFATRSAVSALNSIGRPELLCKKIDSTLRGNLTAELLSICFQAPGRLPIICPAFPAQRRTVVGGVLFVGNDPVRRVSDAFDRELSKQNGFIGLDVIRREPEQLHSHLLKIARGGALAVFFDAETDSDLETVAAAVLLDPARWLPVGSAGFMSATARVVRKEVLGSQDCIDARLRFGLGPVLYACGSRSMVTHKQIAELEQVASVSRDKTVSHAVKSIQDGSRIAIAATPDTEQDRDAVLENLLTGTEELWELPYVSMVVTGGTTAAALLKRCPGFSNLEVLGEFEPGIVLARAMFQSSGNTDVASMNLILKSGAFGDSQTLARIAGL